MKRIACILLILALLMPLCSILVSADGNDDYRHSSITLVVDKNGEASELSLPIIVKDGEFYVAPQKLADITRYQFSADDNRLIYTLGLKSLLIDVSEQTLKVNLSEQAFSGSFFVDGTHYLPMSEMLPWMNVQCYESNGKLHVDSDIKSYWEVVKDFNSQDYLFDLAETYGQTTGDVIGLCAISVFDCILDLGNIWKKVVPVDSGDTNLYEYEIYKECFREFALPEVGSEAEMQKILSEMYDVVSDSSQFLNAYYKPIYTQETHDKIEALFGEEAAKGLEEWPTDAKQITESLKLAKKALKYMKTGYLYARIAAVDTTDYAEALRYIYMREGITPPGGVELAASEAIVALESQAGAVADAAATMMLDVGMSILEDAVEETTEEVVKAVASDTILASLGIYLDIIDATLSLVWPVNDAYAELTKMTVYQEIQYDALNAYYSIKNYNSELTAQDISNARTSALIFLKTARKCFKAQQKTFDLYGGEGVLDWQIKRINDKIQEFQLSALSEENDAICEKSAFTTELKNLFRTIEPAQTQPVPTQPVPTQPVQTQPAPTQPTESHQDPTVRCVGQWTRTEFYEEYGGGNAYLTGLGLEEDGTFFIVTGWEYSEPDFRVSGQWKWDSWAGNTIYIRLKGVCNYISGYGEDAVSEDEPYEAMIRMEIQGDQAYIELHEGDYPALFGGMFVYGIRWNITENTPSPDDPSPQPTGKQRLCQMNVYEDGSLYQRYTFEYDANQRISNMTYLECAGEEEYASYFSFTYDSEGRLLKADRDDSWTYFSNDEYTYDSAGNLICHKVYWGGGNVPYYQYDYSYDGGGNLVGKTSWGINYDEDALEVWTEYSYSYVYDADGRVLERHAYVTWDNDDSDYDVTTEYGTYPSSQYISVERYSYDDEGRVTAVFRANIPKTVFNSQGNPDAKWSGKTYYDYGYAPLILIRNAQDEYTVELWDSAGQVIWHQYLGDNAPTIDPQGYIQGSTDSYNETRYELIYEPAEE